MRFFTCLTVACALFPVTDLAAQAPIEVSSVLLKLVEKVDVPAEQAGVLREIAVNEGALVKAGDALARLDDEAARIGQQRAAADVRIAERLARDRLPVEIAQKSLEQARQRLQQLTLEEKMAVHQAKNLFRVEASDKAFAVAENELKRAKKAKATFDSAVSLSEIEGLQLETEKAGLEAQQSRFEKEIDTLKADVASEGLRGQQLAVGAAELEIAKAEAEYEVAQLQVHVKEQEHALAGLDVQRRQVVSPIDGVVVEIFSHRGEWVEPGQKIMRVLRLNRLWVEGFVRVEDLSRCAEHSRVTVSIPLSTSEVIDVEGRIVYVGREVDPVNREVLIRAEIANDNLRLLPGMDGRMLIHAERTVETSEVKADSNVTP